MGRVVRGLRLGSPKVLAGGPSLRVRSDVKSLKSYVKIAGSATPPQRPPDGGLGATIGQLENDVCAYVCRNDLRTRPWESAAKVLRPWKAGMPVPNPPAPPTLFQFLNPDGEAPTNVRIDARLVDNLANSQGGGLQAHNYWDNASQVVGPLADHLRGLVTALATRLGAP